MIPPLQIIEEFGFVAVVVIDAVTDEIPDRLRPGSVIAAGDIWNARADRIHDGCWADITYCAHSTPEAVYRTRSAPQ